MTIKNKIEIKLNNQHVENIVNQLDETFQNLKMNGAYNRIKSKDNSEYDEYIQLIQGLNHAMFIQKEELKLKIEDFSPFIFPGRRELGEMVVKSFTYDTYFHTLKNYIISDEESLYEGLNSKIQEDVNCIIIESHVSDAYFYKLSTFVITKYIFNYPNKFSIEYEIDITPYFKSLINSNRGKLSFLAENNLWNDSQKQILMSTQNLIENDLTNGDIYTILMDIHDELFNNFKIQTIYPYQHSLNNIILHGGHDL